MVSVLIGPRHGWASVSVGPVGVLASSMIVTSVSTSPGRREVVVEVDVDVGLVLSLVLPVVSPVVVSPVGFSVVADVVVEVVEELVVCGLVRRDSSLARL